MASERARERESERERERERGRWREGGGSRLRYGKGISVKIVKMTCAYLETRLLLNYSLEATLPTLWCLRGTFSRWDLRSGFPGQGDHKGFARGFSPFLSVEVLTMPREKCSRLSYKA